MAGNRIMKLPGRFVETYGPYQIMLKLDRISVYTKNYVTTDNDQLGQIYLGQEVKSQPKQSKFSGFRPELFRHTKRPVCECIAEYTGHNVFNLALKEARLRFTEEDGL